MSDEERDQLRQVIDDMIREAEADGRPFRPCLVRIPEADLVQLFLAPVAHYSDWIKGERADVGLHRAAQTDYVCGATLGLSRYVQMRHEADLQEAVEYIEILLQALRQYVSPKGLQHLGQDVEAAPVSDSMRQAEIFASRIQQEYLDVQAET